MGDRLLLGRDHEQAAITAGLDAARNGLSRALLVRGGPGMGKSALLRFAQEAGADLRQLTVSGVEAESAFPYAGVHRLLVPLLDDRAQLQPRHEQALAVAFGQAAGGPIDRFLVALAVLTVLAEAAARRPLLCVVDDAHWLDAESIDVLAFVGRRLYADSLTMVIAVRGSADVVTALDDLETVDVGALRAEHALGLVEASAPGPVDPLVAHQIVNACDGCPLALVEATRSLSPEQLSGVSVLPRNLPVGPRLEAHFQRQVRDLPPATQTLLLVAAADASNDEVGVRRAMAALELPLTALDPAIDAGLVDSAAPLRFRHPLIRSAVYTGAPNAARRLVHRTLASVTDASAHPDVHALHLAVGNPGPDEGIAELLEKAASAAADRGGYAAQAGLRARAAELTPNASDRARRLLDASEAALSAGLKQRSVALVEQAGSDLDTPVLRARAQRLRGALDAFTVTGDVAAAHLESARALEDLDLRLARDTYAEALQAALVSGQHTRGTTPTEVAAAALRAPRPGGDDTTVVDAMLDGLATRLAVGFPEAGAPLRAAVDAVCKGDLTSSGRTLWSLLGQAAVLEIWDADRYREILDRLEHTQRERGELDSLRVTLLGWCRSETWAGRFSSADAYRVEAAELSLAIDGPGPSADLWGSLGAELLAWQGRDAEARSAVQLLTGPFPESIGAGAAANVGWLALTTLELGQGRYREALESARVLFTHDVPPEATLVLPDLVEAGVRCGDTNAALAALGRLDQRASASGTQWALGLIARCRALLADTREAEPLYREAIARLVKSVVRTDLARAHLLYGEWLRREKRKSDARAQLRAAHAIFSAMGATAFAERARVELDATGVRARRRSVETARDLTPQEDHIARLAAQGETNAEIAERLYLSARTVDYHLRKVYRKLDIASRRDLRRMCH